MPIDEFLHAAATGDYERVKHLVLNMGTDVNRLGNVQPVSLVPNVIYAALHVAAGGGHLDTVKFLVEVGKADVNARSSTTMINRWFDNATPLHFATLGCHLDIVKYLAVDAKVNINARLVSNMTPLEMAARRLDVTMTKLLVEVGADIDDATIEWTMVPTVTLASPARQGKILKLLVDAGMDAQKLDSDGFTALEHARIAGELFFHDPSHFWPALRVLGSHTPLAVPASLTSAKKKNRNDVSVMLHPLLDDRQKRVAETILEVLRDHIGSLPENVCYAVMGFLSFNQVQNEDEVV